MAATVEESTPPDMATAMVSVFVMKKPIGPGVNSFSKPRPANLNHDGGDEGQQKAGPLRMSGP
jgi:hypothetical protein